MTRRARGFTLIEQIAAISLAGAASAVVLPALVDLQADAQATALRSLAQAATSAMVLNQAGCMVTGQSVHAGKCSAVRQCADVAHLLLAGVPPGYRVVDAPLAAASPTSCRLLQEPGRDEALFLGIAAGH
jgi:MSHA pilin protein MshA